MSDSKKGADYTGDVVFVDGVHYPVADTGDKDDEGNVRTHADLSRPLRWVGGATYRDAEKDEPLHNDTHHATDVGLEPGTE